MPTVRFTRNIQRHLECPELSVQGDSLGAALDAYFELHPRARGYVLDDQNRLRHHMALFIDGSQVRDRGGLADVVRADSVIDVVQALSGGQS